MHIIDGISGILYINDQFLKDIMISYGILWSLRGRKIRLVPRMKIQLVTYRQELNY